MERGLRYFSLQQRSQKLRSQKAFSTRFKYGSEAPAWPPCRPDRHSFLGLGSALTTRRLPKFDASYFFGVLDPYLNSVKEQPPTLPYGHWGPVTGFFNKLWEKTSGLYLRSARPLLVRAYSLTNGVPGRELKT